MSDTQFDVLGIGNAIVDIISRCEDELLEELNIPKGHMQLIDAAQAEFLYNKMGPTIEASGGSVANTCAGLASLGARTAFIGKVAQDHFGKVFRHDISSIGVSHATPMELNGQPTARCLIFVSPDGERTMSTFLGVSVDLGNGEVDEQTVKSSKIIYLEGYLFDKQEAKDAFHRAAKMAAEAGRKVALSLSDSFCVERHRIAFRGLIQDRVDILLANEAEICAVYKASTFEAAIEKLRTECHVAAITRGAKGSLIITPHETIEIPAIPVDEVVDTTGAGDQYAAGFLFGYANGLPLKGCGQLGSMAAAEVISHMGARPQRNLGDLARTTGLLA